MMDEVAIELKNVLQANMGSRVKTYYVGDPGISVLKNYCPVLCVIPEGTDVERPNTGQNQYRFHVLIRVITDVMQSVNEAGITNGLIVSQQVLRQIIEEEDPTDKAPKTNTVLGCLLKQSLIQGVNYVYNYTPKVNYNLIRGDKFFAVVAEVRFDMIKNYTTRKQ